MDPSVGPDSDPRNTPDPDPDPDPDQGDDPEAGVVSECVGGC